MSKTLNPILNEKIKGHQFRLVGAEGAEVKTGVIDRLSLFSLADNLGLDVLLVNATTNPVCVKLINWEKHEYKKKKIEHENKKKNKTTQKEVRISPNIQPHDVEHKLKTAKNFLSRGDKVKVTMQLKGRQNNAIFKENANLTMLKFIQELTDVGVAESLPQFMSGKFIVTIKPKKS